MSDQYSSPVPPTETPVKKKNPWIIVLIIVVVLLVICCICALLVPTILALLGPSVGNVFSNIIEGLGTPTP
jgi:small neutral amino acid transporter SnatA (MarC family)